MSDIVFTNVISTELVRAQASDLDVVNAARVSTQGIDAVTNEKESAGLINFLMRNRHGTPFEHNSFTFFVDAPIFVFREFHRHRIGFSYNEESGRYKELRGKFFIPDRERNLTQIGKPGAYNFGPGSDEQYSFTIAEIKHACTEAYGCYQNMLNAGIAKEVARMCLPVNTYSSMFVTCNARSLMAFLSLRQKHTQAQAIAKATSIPSLPEIVWVGEAMFQSDPMKEINRVADDLEDVFKEYMPLTHSAFVGGKYVSP